MYIYKELYLNGMDIKKGFNMNNIIKKKNFINNILPYAGHKTRVLPLVFSLLPNNFETYYEPFMGMGVIGFNIIKHHEMFDVENIYMSDINKDNINLFNNIKNKLNDFFEEYKNLHSISVSTENFIKIRNEYNENSKSFESNVKYAYLLKYCFGGIVRKNKDGQFNISIDKTRTTDKISLIEKRLNNDLKRFIEYNKLLNNDKINIDIKYENYYDLYKNIKNDESNLIVLDPPYSGSDVNYTTCKNEKINIFDNLNFKIFEDCNYHQNDNNIKYMLFDYLSHNDLISSPIWQRLGDGKIWSNYFTNYYFSIQQKSIKNQQKGIEVISCNY